MKKMGEKTKKKKTKKKERKNPLSLNKAHIFAEESLSRRSAAVSRSRTAPHFSSQPGKGLGFSLRFLVGWLVGSVSGGLGYLYTASAPLRLNFGGLFSSQPMH